MKEREAVRTKGRQEEINEERKADGHTGRNKGRKKES